jgi:hypothetical protein
MFTKNIIFLLIIISHSLIALPVSLIKNQTSNQIVINAIAIKAKSVARIKNLEIPFTSWIQFRTAIVDGDEYCPEKSLRIVVGSRVWMIWANELGIWGLIIDESMPLSPSDRKPLLLIKAQDMLKSQATLIINEEKLEIQI